METNEPDRRGVRMIAGEAGMHERTAHLRVHAVQCWTRARYRRECAREHACGEPGAATDSVDAVLTVLESDLCYLEELPASRIASSGGMLDEMDGRLKRLIASLKGSAA